MKAASTTIRESRNEIYDAVAERLATTLYEGLQIKSRVCLVVSGGTTPGPVYDRLALSNIDWRRVDVCLTDERCVPVTHDASNQRMVHERLLVNSARMARFVPLNHSSLEEICGVATCSLVGMGEDGHFASLFPGSHALRAGLDMEGSHSVVQVQDAPDGLPRISMTLPKLTASNNLTLLTFGDRKREILKSPEGFPIEHLLVQNRACIHVYWAP